MTPGLKDARELLAFYLDAGVDAVVGEAPVDRMADEIPPAAPAAPPPRQRSAPSPAAPPAERTFFQSRAPAAPPPSPDAAVMAAREAARSAGSLEELRAILERFEGCALRNTATRLVFADGHPGSRLMFVGEAPGRDEDIQGLPFVGRSGQLLDRMIAAMGLSPETDAYVCNIIKCRPPGNRRPEPEEIAACIPYLHEQLQLVDPRVIVALGNTAVAALLDTKLGITKIRGQWKLYRGRTLVMPTYHPSYLLRPSPQQIEAKRQAWEDLQLVMKELGLPGRASNPTHRS